MSTRIKLLISILVVKEHQGTLQHQDTLQQDTLQRQDTLQQDTLQRQEGSLLSISAGRCQLGVSSDTKSVRTVSEPSELSEGHKLWNLECRIQVCGIWMQNPYSDTPL